LFPLAGGVWRTKMLKKQRSTFTFRNDAMPFRCPICEQDVDAGNKECPRCKEPLHLASFFQRFWRGLLAAFTRATCVECPLCHQTSAAKSRYCMSCGCDFSIAAALIPVLRPLRRKWDALFNDMTPATKRSLRIGYVLVSAILFWLMLRYSEKQGTDWYLHAGLSIVYVTFLTLFVFFVVPREHLARFARQRKPVERIGLICNYFTILLVIQACLATWKQKGTMLAALFVVSWLGSLIFLVYVYPVWVGFATFFTEPDRAAFDPTARQGRTARRG